jgi:surface antigen
MKSGWGWTLVWGVLLAAGLMAPSRRAAAGNCALFARAETGVALYGAAGNWWNEATGIYQRGNVPEVGSILVFRRSGFMPSGHVAVVSKVIRPGQILVDQSNWYHGRITRDTPVIDTSPNHDWSEVAVMNIGSGEFGRDSPTYGFVYPGTGPQGVVAAAVGFDPYPAASRAAYRAGSGGDLFHFAVNDDGSSADLGDHEPADFRHRRRYSRRREHRRWAPRTGEHTRTRSEHHWAQHAAHGRTAHAATINGKAIANGHRPA